MKSVCTGHYPQIVYRNRERRLWNPVMKKPAVNLPEERVRLRFLEALLYESSIPPSRISTEKGLEMIAGQSGRSDILCYNQDFEPLLLVECKREQIKLGENAALQIGRYNEKIQAPILALTNGNDDFWYDKGDNGGIRLLDRPPAGMMPGDKPVERDLDYWVQRGFAGRKILESNPDPVLQQWLLTLLTDAFIPNGGSHEAAAAGSAGAPGVTSGAEPDSCPASESDAIQSAASVSASPATPDAPPAGRSAGTLPHAGSVRYLQIPPSRHIRDLAHYYRISSWPEEKLMIGVTGVSTLAGDTLIIAVAVYNEVPVALLEVNVSMMINKNSENAFFRSRTVEKGFDIGKNVGWGLNSGDSGDSGDLSDSSYSGTDSLVNTGITSGTSESSNTGNPGNTCITGKTGSPGTLDELSAITRSLLKQYELIPS